MPVTSFETLADEAKLWVYVADRTLTDAELETLDEFLDRFLDQWTSHGRAVEGAFEIRDRRILLLAGHIADAEISGCGIDESVRTIDRIAEEMGFSWLPALNVFYRNAEGNVVATDRSTFRELADKNEITAETSVFDPTIDRVKALREDGLERSARSSWHASVFPIGEPA